MLHNLKFSRELNFIFISIFLFAVAMGIDFVVFPTILTLHGISPNKIGFASACEIIGGILASFFLGRFVLKLGIMRALKISSLSYAIAISLIYFYQNFIIWVIFALFMGCCWFIYVITRQSWLNILLKDEQRGVASGVFSMIIAAGLSLGPVIVSYLGAASYSSFLASALLVLLSYYFVSFLKKLPQPKIEAKRIKLIEFFRHNPRCFMARFFMDFQGHLLLVFTVVFGSKIGLSYEASGLLISAFMASCVFDIAVGFLLKKTDPYKLINIGFLGCVCSLIIILLYSELYPLLVVLYFTLGLSAACIFVSVFKITNEDYKKEKLVAANSTFQIIGSIGSISGALAGGFLINVFGAQGFPIALMLGCISYLTFLVIYDKKYSQKN